MHSPNIYIYFPCVLYLNPILQYDHEVYSLVDDGGPAPVSTRWTVLCMDLQYLLSMYLNRRYSYIKSAKLCANMMVKNIFTSDTLYEPGPVYVMVYLRLIYFYVYISTASCDNITTRFLKLIFSICWMNRITLHNLYKNIIQIDTLEICIKRVLSKSKLSQCEGIMIIFFVFPDHTTK